MHDKEDLNAQRTRMMEIWHEYGKSYNVFVPAEQPAPWIWDRPLQEPDDKSRWNPQTIKHWRFLVLTKRLLKKRYGVLSGPALTFDCQVPAFQEGLSQYKPKPRERLHHNGDPLRWYSEALEMFITSRDEVGFDCHSTVCLRTRCKLNIRNPDRISPVDIFSLIQIFHGFRSINQAIRIVSEELGSIDRFESGSIHERGKILRYAGKRHQHVPQLIEEATDLIRTSMIVELDHGRVFSNYFAFFWPQIIENNILTGINGLAIRLYLWLLIIQEEHARENSWGMQLTDAEIARKLGIFRKTAGIYRKELQKLGLLKILLPGFQEYS
jgi:hypothetical protein